MTPATGIYPFEFSFVVTENTDFLIVEFFITIIILTCTFTPMFGRLLNFGLHCGNAPWYFSCEFSELMFVGLTSQVYFCHEHNRELRGGVNTSRE